MTVIFRARNVEDRVELCNADARVILELMGRESQSLQGRMVIGKAKRKLEGILERDLAEHARTKDDPTDAMSLVALSEDVEALRALVRKAECVASKELLWE